MMHRIALLKQLYQYNPTDREEKKNLAAIIEFVQSHQDCFERTCKPGHITGSAWLIDPTNTKVLLTHHKKLNKWLQLGGHADGNPNILEVAIQEAQEESGIHSIVPVFDTIFDIDVHLIPARKDEVEHFHYDIRYLLQATSDTKFIISDESFDLQWVPIDKMNDITLDKSLTRMLKKWNEFRHGTN